jgi:hypothetical protein
MARNRKLPKRGKRPSFRLSDEENEQLTAAAKEAGMNISAYIRAAFPMLLSEAGRIQKGRVRRPDDESMKQCLMALHRLRVNMEALLAWCRTYKGLAETAIITAHLVALEREVARLTEGLRDHA